MAEIEITMTTREVLEWVAFLDLEREQNAEAQSINPALLGQVLKFDAQLNAMKSVTPDELKELEQMSQQ